MRAGGQSKVAAQLYFEAKLEAKDLEIEQLKVEAQQTGAQGQILEMVDKAKEARLLKEQNTKMQKELAQLREKPGEGGSTGIMSMFRGGTSTKASSKGDAKPADELPGLGAGRTPVRSLGGSAHHRPNGLQQEGLRKIYRMALAAKGELATIKSELRAWSTIADEIRMRCASDVALACSRVVVSDGARTTTNERGRTGSPEMQIENQALKSALDRAESGARETTQECTSLRDTIERLRADASRSSSEDSGMAERLAEQARLLGDSETELIKLRAAARDSQNAVNSTTVDQDESVGRLERLVAELQEKVDQGKAVLKAKEDELTDKAQMEIASFEIERNALLTDNRNLRRRLGDLEQTNLAAQAGAGESETALRKQVDSLRADCELLTSQRDKAQAATTQAQEKSALHKAANMKQTTELEQLHAQVNAAEEKTAKIKVKATNKLEVLVAEVTALTAARQDLETTVEAQKQEVLVREKKAASECERMFKLVQQAHEKMNSKEQEFQQQLATEKNRFDAELETEVQKRMQGIQQKFEEEAALRRKLFNEVQALKGNIRVYCRVRPCIAYDGNDETGIDFDGPYDDILVQNPRQQLPPKKFEFEKTFKPECTQSQLFDEISPLVTSVLDGYNVCIFAYGQTGSGKTHTMEGPESDRGVYFRAMEELFKIMAERSEFEKTEITVSQLEIYNEQIRDLLCPKVDQENLEIRRGPRGAFVPGLIAVPVAAADDVMKVLAEGNKNRSVANTKMNAESSRSHSVLTINAAVKRVGKNGQVLDPVARLVDRC
jgi:kinesin family protein C2/C3